MLFQLAFSDIYSSRINVLGEYAINIFVRDFRIDDKLGPNQIYKGLGESTLCQSVLGWTAINLVNLLPLISAHVW